MASKLLGCALTLAVACTLVDAAAAEQSPSTVGDLQDLQARIIMMRASNMLADETSKMAQRTAQSSTGEPRESAHPVVVQVSGQSDRPTVYLMLADGSVVTAKPGATVRGGFRIVEVTARQVLATRNGETYSLGFGSRMPRQSYGAGETQVR